MSFAYRALPGLLLAVLIVVLALMLPSCASPEQEMGQSVSQLDAMHDAICAAGADTPECQK